MVNDILCQSQSHPNFSSHTNVSMFFYLLFITINTITLHVLYFCLASTRNIKQIISEPHLVSWQYYNILSTPIILNHLAHQPRQSMYHKNSILSTLTSVSVPLHLSLISQIYSITLLKLLENFSFWFFLIISSVCSFLIFHLFIPTLCNNITPTQSTIVYP